MGRARGHAAAPGRPSSRPRRRSEVRAARGCALADGEEGGEVGRGGAASCRHCRYLHGRRGRRRPGGRRRRAPCGSCREEAPGPRPGALEAAAAAMAPRGLTMAARRQRPLPLQLESLRPQPSSARQRRGRGRNGRRSRGARHRYSPLQLGSRPSAATATLLVSSARGRAPPCSPLPAGATSRHSLALHRQS